jgi:hypothetical protein
MTALKGGDSMSNPTFHRASGHALIGLAVVALVTVMTGFWQPRPLPTDEGTGAHIFQLAVVAMLPVGAIFVVTTPAEERGQILRKLVVPAAVLAAAFVALYFLEHGR